MRPVLTFTSRITEKYREIIALFQIIHAPQPAASNILKIHQQIHKLPSFPAPSALQITFTISVQNIVDFKHIVNLILEKKATMISVFEHPDRAKPALRNKSFASSTDNSNAMVNVMLSYKLQNPSFLFHLSCEEASGKASLPSD